jgi:hypothetical protein
MTFWAGSGFCTKGNYGARKVYESDNGKTDSRVITGYTEYKTHTEQLPYFKSSQLTRKLAKP